MPYPSEAATNKHDLLCPRLPPDDPDGSSSSSSSTPLQDTMGYQSTADLFRALDDFHTIGGGANKSIKNLCSVYSYADAPHPPLSRSLMVVGVASQSLGAVRKLLKKKKEDYDDHGHVLCSCTLAVKRGDGHNLTRLDPRRDVPNSASFAHLCHLLREENAVAVLAPDKYGRFALLRPISAAEYDGNDAAGGHRRRRRRVSATASTLADLPSEDFYADLFVGKVGDAKEYLASSPPQQEEPQLSPYSPSSPIWQPSTPPALPPPDDNDEPCTSSSPLIQPATPPLDQINRSNPLVSSGLWVPPGATGHANDGTDDNLWQPPSEGEGGGGGYGWSTSAGESVGGGIDSKKRSRTEDSDENDIDNDDASSSGDYHADVGAAAADAFYSGLTRSLDTRADSRIYHMRAFNGWVKATQIQELDPKTTNATAKGSRGKAAGGGGSDQGLRLLDLACGKGGDLGKWVLHPRGISNYVGIDVARGSLRDAAIRARTPNLRSKLPRCTFTCADLGSDVPGRLKSNLSSRKSDRMQKLLSWSLQNDDPTNVTGPPKFRMVRGGGISPNDRFDVVSIQFAIHYMMSTRKRARRFFQTVSELLEVGGNLIATTIDARVVVQHLMNLGLNLHFGSENGKGSRAAGEVGGVKEDAVIRVGNGACQIRFQPEQVQRIFGGSSAESTDDGDNEGKLFGIEYTFTLVEGSEHARGVGDAVNLPEWLTPIPALEALADEAGLELEYAHNFHEFYALRRDPTTNAAAHAALYNMKVLNRNGSIAPDEWEISRLYVAIKFRKVRESSMKLDNEEDDADEEEDDDPDGDEEVPDIDPIKKAKVLPMAMMKAKKAIGDEAWKALSSEEKTRLTDHELRRLAADS